MINLNEEASKEVSKGKIVENLDINAAKNTPTTQSELENESPPSAMFLESTPDSSGRALSPQLSSCSERNGPVLNIRKTTSKNTKAFFLYLNQTHCIIKF